MSLSIFLKKSIRKIGLFKYLIILSVVNSVLASDFSLSKLGKITLIISYTLEGPVTLDTNQYNCS